MGSQDESTPLLSRKGAERRPERKTRMREVFNIIVCIACLYYFMFGIEKIGKFTMDLIRGRLAPRPGVGDGPRGQQAVDGKWHWTWESVTPSTELSWTPCYPWASADFYCSRLTVPMDYHRPLDDEHPEHPQVQLALVLLPGKNSTFLNGGRFNPSPILFNPGGPGGSGTLLVVGLGEALQKVVGEHHDLIGFDPRGIGSSQPKADCFLHGHPKEAPVTVADENAAMMRRFAYELTRLDVGLVNSSSVALGKIDAHHRGKAQLCAERDEELGDNSIFRYMGTPNVARDMLSIVHAWDRWTERMDMTGREHMMETRGKLVYWGFSYGTMLGATYAAMFPDKVGRVILDGVVDADLYVGETWRESLRDTDYIEDKLFDYCAEAGTMCRLYRKGDTPADIRARFEGVMARLRAEPLHIVHPYAHMPLLVSYSDVKALLFTSLYSPNTMFPTIALLVDLLARQLDISPLLTPLDLGSMCVTKDMTWPIYPDDGLAGVMCGDKRYKLNETLPELEKRFLGFANFSRFADVWMDVALACDGWEVESRDPPMRWDDQPAKRQKPIKTSFPVLFLSNSHDPVTPLYAGVKMATKFEGAGLVEQRSEGHCTIASVSLCTIGKIRAYLNDGIVPPPPILKKEGDFSEGEWDICEANEYPWKPYRGSGLGGDEPSGKDTVFAGPLDDNVYALAEASAKIRERMVQLVTSAHPSPLIRALTERFGMFFAGDVALLDKMLQLYQERRIHRRHLDMDAAEDRIRIL